MAPPAIAPPHWRAHLEAEEESALYDGLARALAECADAMLALDYPRLARGACPLDGLPLAIGEHPRCRVCGLLVGPGHAATTLDGGRCQECARAHHHRSEARR
jgi:hypothetical protein